VGRRGSLSIIQGLSILLLLLAATLAVFQLVAYSNIRSSFSPGTVIAGIPMGGLNQQQAAERLMQAFSMPIEIHYNEAVIQIKPSVAGFQLDLEGMLAAADMQRTSLPFWTAFWDYLWNRLPPPAEVPLRSSINEERLRTYLKNEISTRYDQPAGVALPVPGSTNFEGGQAGTALDVERAIVLVGDALRSPTARVVTLSYNRLGPERPSAQNLQILLQQVVDVADFDGIVELYLYDLQTAQELHFAYQDGKNLTPDIAFTAASTMKIPIMVSVFRRMNDPAPKDVTELIELMIERSENDPADRLMQRAIHPETGPLGVADDLQTLGLSNTFLAGYFYPGAQLLKRFQTTANQRADVFTSPDPYNQTTALEMGLLLDDIYQCADSGGGALMAAFPGQITQNECRQMITYLSRNKIAVLLQAGLPEGTQIAHKHGWITEADGVIHTVSDAAIVYTPGGNYILTVYVYHPVQAVWDKVNLMVAQLSSTVYNYFNLPQ